MSSASTDGLYLPTRLSRLKSFLALPTQCRLCQSWQSELVCQPCLTRWRQPGMRCARCAILLPHHASDSVCQACQEAPPEFDRTIAALDYAAPWAGLLARLKFMDDTALAPMLARLLNDAVSKHPHPVDLIVPIPLSVKRQQERGYNQAWLIARHLARLQGTAAHPDVLRRTHETQRLMNLDAEARRQQIRGAFVMNPEALRQIQGRDIALVDDVLTTGATLSEAAAVLREAGARSITAWVVARTPAPEQLLQGATDSIWPETEPWARPSHRTGTHSRFE